MGHHVENTTKNTQFVFDGKTKLFTFGLMAVGIICLVLTLLVGGEHNYARLWTNILHNGVFFTGISFAALFFICTHTLGWGGWHIIFRRVPEAMMMFMPIGVISLLVVAIAIAMDAPGTELIYMWADEEVLATDKLVQHKSALLNPTAYFLTIVIVLVWTLFAVIIRKISIKQDSQNNPEEATQSLYKIRFWGAIFLPIAGFSSAYAIWLWVMSVDTHWYSTLFAWYASVSWWVSAMALMLLLAAFLKSRGHLELFTREHLHDLGKYVFGFSVFWTYLWFSQFLLIWYANNGEETQYFYLRFEQFKPIFFLNIIVNFLVPFFALMMNSSKRTMGTVGFVAGLVILGHWLDFYQMIKPGVWYNIEHKAHAAHDHHDHKHGSIDNNFDGAKAQFTYYTPDSIGAETTIAEDTHHSQVPGVEGEETQHVTTTEHTHTADVHGHEEAHGHGNAHAHGPAFETGFHFPGILELGTMVGFLGLFLFVTLSFLSKAAIYPKNDPFLGESEHHHV